jgi:hypothetical protein
MLWQDLRYAWRGLRGSPGFAIAAVLTLALGIGANTAIFSILDALVLRELPVRSAGQLVLVQSAGSLQELAIWERPAYEILRDHNRAFSGVLAFSPIRASKVTRGGRTSSAQSEGVSENYFTVLGVRPFAGRLTGSVAGHGSSEAPEAVLSFDYWRREFQSDPDVIGKTLRLGNFAHAIIGVTPPNFFGAVVGASPDLYVPFGGSQSADWVTILGRLKAGVSRERAQESLGPLFQEICRQSQIPAVERR